jgi:hypothetical protein
LKRQGRDLLEELERLQNGAVIRLEFRHGLPFLLETTPTVFPLRESPPEVRRPPREGEAFPANAGWTQEQLAGIDPSLY